MLYFNMKSFIIFALCILMMGCSTNQLAEGNQSDFIGQETIVVSNDAVDSSKSEVSKVEVEEAVVEETKVEETEAEVEVEETKVEETEAEETQVEETKAEEVAVKETEEVAVKETEAEETEAEETKVEETKVEDIEVEETKAEETEAEETEAEEIIESRKGTIYCNYTARLRTGPHISYQELAVVKYGETVELLGESSGSWSTAKFGDQEGWIYTPYFQDIEPPKQLDMSSFPLVWEDGDNKITINKQNMYNNWCYVAHLEFSDYERFGSAIAHNSRGSYETTSAAAKRLGAVFCVNGPYSWGELANSYAIIRSDTVFHDKGIEDDLGTYSNVTGKLVRAKELGVSGKTASSVAGKSVSDTFKFWNSTLVLNGKNTANIDNHGRAQRTFIGTTGNAGDIYVICSEGRYVDGSSAGLTKYECAKVLLDLGCTYGIMLDGGGSTTMYFNGQVLTSSRYNQRAVVDFVYFK